MRSLKPVAPAQIGAVWPRLRAPLEDTGASDGTIPEDVYCAIKMGGASLHLLMVDDVECGFVVLRGIQDFDGARLHIWVLYAKSDVDVMAEFSDELDNLARNINAAKITFGTSRRGWERVAPRYHFQVREIVYERKIKS
jgi:hypothetical protein